MALHVLAHVDADHGLGVVEQEVGQRSGQLGLPHAGGSHEQERPDGAVGIRQPSSAAPYGVGNGGDGLVLTDHPGMEGVLHPDQLLHLAFEETADRHPGGPADDLGHVFGIHLFFQEALGLLELVEQHRGLFDLALEVRNDAVGDLGGLGQVALAPQPLGVAALLLELALEGLDSGDGLFFRLPMGSHGRRLLGQVGHLLVQPGQAVGRGRVGLLGQGHPLDLQLTEPPSDHVELGGHRVDLDTQPAGRFVHQVDGLVG